MRRLSGHLEAERPGTSKHGCSNFAGVTYGAGGSASAVGVDWQLAATFSARLRKLLLLPTRRSVLRDPQGPQLLPWHKVTWTQPEWCCCLHNHHGKGRDARNGGCRVQTCCVTAYGTRCHEPCNVWSSMHVCRTKENSRVSFRSHTTHTRPIPRKSELMERNVSFRPKIRHFSLWPFQTALRPPLSALKVLERGLRGA